jgi:hypothetical protein
MSLLTVGLIMNMCSSALAKAKSSKHKAYSYFDDGGKSSQEKCDPERKIPRKLKTELKKANNYLGSERVDSELLAKGEAKPWKHFFSLQSACEHILSQQQKSFELKSKKVLIEKSKEPEKPDSAENEEDADDAEEEEESENSG